MSDSFVLVSLFIVALSYGATACMFSCMPIVSPILLANGATREASLRALLPLTLGRISGYVILALVAYTGSIFVKSLIKDTELMGYLLGSLTLFMAFRLWLDARRTASCCSTTPSTPKSTLSLYLSGALLSMSICAPVVTMMTLSAASSTWYGALAYGFVFALGASILWFLFFSIVLTKVLQESLVHLGTYRTLLRHAAPIFLGVVGVAIFNGWLHL